MILEDQKPQVSEETLGLAISISVNPQNADRFCEGDHVSFLMKRANQNKDPMLMKLLKTIATYESSQVVLLARKLLSYMLIVVAICRVSSRYHAQTVTNN